MAGAAPGGCDRRGFRQVPFLLADIRANIFVYR